ncbi:MAG: hypothetical protein RXQ68_00100 [Candidatus Nanopusillus sp.]
MESQQSYESSKKISELIENLNKWLGEEDNKRLEEEINKRLEYPMNELGDSLYKMAKDAQKKVNLSEMEGIDAVIDLYCYKSGNEPMECGYYISADVYNRNKGIRCLSNSPYLPNRVKCTDYSKIDSELYDPSQSASFVQNIINSILNAYNIYKPETFMNMGKKHIHFRSVASVNPEGSIKENPEIVKDGNKIKYNNGIYVIEITAEPYNPFKP